MPKKLNFDPSKKSLKRMDRAQRQLEVILAHQKAKREHVKASIRAQDRISP